ncbi:GH92 family glycosyl hydrolase [Hufsiella ginkgonis]|uniref:Glycoside hydrolase family 92 protein n=1 Tax=Hufsiella ginkgonis TaxID=2695274 RepID=A0A7K1XWP1_9SPHI|nr:GH92 family glycosyl hydrolase [Hufsiella ginkgonis]MXV15423.1 glycoside hydrolase family 92 protein [Hufsiella ginkgonis]
MKNLKKLCLAIAVTATGLTDPASARKGHGLVQYVDPKIGTAHSRWFFFTPGALPFGMAKPAPSTNGSYGNAHGWDAVGYDYRHESIEGFANFHEFQVGGVVFAPITGKLQTIPGRLEKPDDGYRSRFDRKDEIATAGYYSVLLKDYGITAELTATKRVAFHRYTFPAGNESHILFDIGNKQGESGEVKSAKVTITADGHIEGYVTTLPVYVQKYQPGAEVTMYFSAVADKKPLKTGTFRGAEQFPGQTSIEGKGAGVYLTFATRRGEKINVKAGLSFTSVENARLNLQEEAATLDFDRAKARALREWEQQLGRIRVRSAVKTDMVKFYTGLYHSLLGRGLASDVNGAYPKNDGTVGQIPLNAHGKPLFNHYNTDAVWGAFWNLTQLWAIAYPSYYSDFVKSQLLVYKDSGWLADGIANSRYVSGVGTNFVSLVMASAYLSGIRDFDVNLAYEASMKNDTDGKDRPRGAGKLDVASFVEKGFVDHFDKGTGGDEKWRYSASHTMEYAFSAYAMANWAQALGKQQDYDKMSKLSAGWENLYDPQMSLIRPKMANGEFIANFNPNEVWRGFQEGNAWQYTYYVPQDPEKLIAKVGRDNFNARLDNVFVTSRKNVFGGGTTLDAFSGLEGLYNHGNQPNLHISWLFNYSGRPSLTQKWVRAICNEFYGSDGIHGYGYGQDEDQGQLGAWYVMSSIGLFDVKGFTSASNTVGLGSPLFSSVEIKLDPRYFTGKKFTITADGGSAVNQYVQSFRLNGQLVHQPFIKLTDIQYGGKLQLKMGESPVDAY